MIMTEFPLLTSSNTYIKNMVFGVDPITGEILLSDDIINYNYIPKFFSYFADKISNGFEKFDKFSKEYLND